MAGKRKIEIFIDIDHPREFEFALKRHRKKLICAEIYFSNFGPAKILDRIFTTIKLVWSNNEMVLLRVLSDEIEAFKRFHDHSEAVFMFIVNMRVTSVVRGVNVVRLETAAKREIKYFNDAANGLEDDRITYSLAEPTPDEVVWYKKLEEERQKKEHVINLVKSKRQMARKRYRAEKMALQLKHLNFVLYWPHSRRAHPELYGLWDLNDIIMVDRDEVQLSAAAARDVLYAGDAPDNEASMHALLAAPALAICFRLLDTDKDFVATVRRVLYEEICQVEGNTPAGEVPTKTAFDMYKSYSPTREQIKQQKKEAKLKIKAMKVEKRARLLSEMQRLARDQIAEVLEARKIARENKKLELLKSGNIAALKKLNEEPEDERVSIEIPEELPGAQSDSSSEEEDDQEYHPPPGLLIPGFYAPPNEIAKANGLAILFPKIVEQNAVVDPEVLPPHVLVMFPITKRHRVIKELDKHSSFIIHMGIFEAPNPYKARHIAYSVKEYDGTLNYKDENENTKLCIMLRTDKEMPLLSMVELVPEHVSRNDEIGENECQAVFHLKYLDRLEDDFPSLRCASLEVEN